MKNYNFAVDKTVYEIKQWIRDEYREISNPNGNSHSLVIGISGNMDSAITAALCAEAVGADNIIGVIMPYGKERDKYNAVEICNYLNINYIEADITKSVNTLTTCYDEIYIPSTDEYIKFGTASVENVMPFGMKQLTRDLVLRMIANSFNGVVVNTCNLSESYTNKFRDSYTIKCGYIAPIILLTTDEVEAIGRYLDLPDYFFIQSCYDDLTGTDYSKINDYIRTGNYDNKLVAQQYSKMANQAVNDENLPRKFYPDAEITVSFFD